MSLIIQRQKDNLIKVAQKIKDAQMPTGLFDYLSYCYQNKID